MSPLSPLSPLTVVALAICSLGACAQLDGDRGTGITVTADGRMVDNTAANRQISAQRQIEKSVDAALGASWSCTATITQLPVWREFMVKGDGDWYWEAADVQVVVSRHGSGHGTPPVSVEELRSGVVKYMTGMMAKGKKDSVTVTVKIPEPAAHDVAKPIPDPRPPQEPAGQLQLKQGERSYRIQAGDTLAEITTLFYGSATDWRRIVTANPGLDPAHLTPGVDLVIPPLPPLIREQPAP